MHGLLVSKAIYIQYVQVNRNSNKDILSLGKAINKTVVNFPFA